MKLGSENLHAQTSGASQDTETTQPASDPFADVPVLSKTRAELYLFDTETDVFVIQEKEVDVDMALNGEYDGGSRLEASDR